MERRGDQNSSALKPLVEETMLPCQQTEDIAQ
jgi:hypothetical protein